MSRILFTSIFTWLLFIPVAITNGIIREKTYKKLVSDLTAHQISTVIASIAFFTLTYFMIGNKIKNINNYSLLLIGFMWVIMTITFEFGFGHYVDGASWEKLWTDYNLLKGHVWSIFLLVVLLSPYLTKLLKK